MKFNNFNKTSKLKQNLDHKLLLIRFKSNFTSQLFKIILKKLSFNSKKIPKFKTDKKLSGSSAIIINLSLF